MAGPQTATLDVEDDMTEDQMQTLLQDAAHRLRQQQSLQVSDKSTDFRFPRLDVGEIPRSYTTASKDGVAQLLPSARADSKDRKSSNQIRKVEDPVAVRNRQTEMKKATAGDRWFNLPKTDMTPEFKRDLQLIKMRNVLDPHRHYKKDNGKLKAPEYSQVGTLVEGPTEYYSGRILNKDRKRTFVEEVLSGEQETGRFKRKYGEIQDKKTSGKKAHYKALMAKRSTNFKKR